MSVYVKFWGVRGSIPTPGWTTRVYGGNTSCVELRWSDTLFVCDAGTGIRPLGLDLVKRGGGPINGHLLFSHAHWDHIQGFPFFVPVFNPANTFHIYGTGEAGDYFHRLLSGQMASEYFPVQFERLGATILPSALGASGTEVDGVRLSWIEQHHPGGSLGFRFERDGLAVVYMTDNEYDQELLNAAEVAADPSALRRIPQRFLDFARGADLMIADGQYTDAEYAGKVGWGHPRDFTVVDVAIQAGVKQLAITHHDPMDTDERIDAKLDACRRRVASFGQKLQVFAAREGVEFKYQ